MHFCKAKIAIGGDNRNIFAAGAFSPVSWPEIFVLQALHGEQSIDEVEPFAAAEQTPRGERDRLARKYGDVIVNEVFGGQQGRPHEMEAPQARIMAGVEWFNPITETTETTRNGAAAHADEEKTDGAHANATGNGGQSARRSRP